MTEQRPYGVPSTSHQALARMVEKQRRLDQELVKHFGVMIATLEDIKLKKQRR